MVDGLFDSALSDESRARRRELVVLKRKVIIGLVVVGIPAVLLTPPPFGKWVWVALLAVAIVCVAVIEIRRLMVFKEGLKTPASKE
jgi:hypothetical protein